MQTGEQLQFSPQLQRFVRAAVSALRQPHLHSSPAQDAHLHWFDFIDIGISFSLSELAALCRANN